YPIAASIATRVSSDVERSSLPSCDRYDDRIPSRSASWCSAVACGMLSRQVARLLTRATRRSLPHRRENQRAERREGQPQRLRITVEGRRLRLHQLGATEPASAKAWIVARENARVLTRLRHADAIVLARNGRQVERDH